MRFHCFNMFHFWPILNTTNVIDKLSKFNRLKTNKSCNNKFFISLKQIKRNKKFARITNVAKIKST